MKNSSMQGQGDDGFNIHGNFIVVESILTDPSRMSYINEGGAGWVESSPMFMIGDAVQFYARGTLQPLGPPNRIVAATPTAVSFQHPIDATVQRFDMFLSLKRVASLEMTDCFFGNSNARGIVLSAINATIERSTYTYNPNVGCDLWSLERLLVIAATFANLSCTAMLILEGGCGGMAGDYTEGPFSVRLLMLFWWIVGLRWANRLGGQHITILRHYTVSAWHYTQALHHSV